MRPPRDAHGELQGRRVLILRTEEQAAELSASLKRLGAATTAISVIRSEPAVLSEGARAAVESVATFDWIVFTSVNTVRALARVGGERFFRALQEGRTRVASIGAATAKALERLDVQVDLIPKVHSSAGLLEALEALSPATLLLPQSNIAGDALAQSLRAVGFTVVQVPVYRTVSDRDGARAAIDVLAAGNVQLLMFSSPSTVSALSEVYGGGLHDLLRGIGVVCIGERTASAAKLRGIDVGAVARSPDAAGLVAAAQEAAGRL